MIIFIYLFIIRTIESLYEELAREGVVMKCPKFHLSDYIGDFRYTHVHVLQSCASLSPSHLSLSFSYLATTLRQMPVDPNNTDKNAEKIEPMPSLADVRRIITEHCILPLGMREGRGKERKRA